MAAGETTSAAERHKQRLGAASVRADLVDVIGRMDGSPSAQQIKAWLDHLTDAEVLERISGLQVTHAFCPVVEVLVGMRDEARRFRPGSRDVDQ